MKASNDPIGDFLTRIRNANRAKLDTCIAPYSRIKEDIARILKEDGYIRSYEIKEDGDFKEILVNMKYVDGTPSIVNLKRISKPGVRFYTGVKECPKVIGGMGISIISTSKGLMDDHNARKNNIGGELLAQVW